MQTVQKKQSLEGYDTKIFDLFESLKAAKLVFEKDVQPYSIEEMNNNQTEIESDEFLKKCKSIYDELHEAVKIKTDIATKGRSVIVELEEVIMTIKDIVVQAHTESNEIKGDMNEVVDKMISKEEEIYFKQTKPLEQELDEQRLKFEEKKNSLLELKMEQIPCLTARRHTRKTSFSFIVDSRIKDIGISFNPLIEWSGFSDVEIIFDSNVDGSIGNNMFNSRIMNKKFLYFITFDEFGNVFGCYTSNRIVSVGHYNIDSNGFIFALKKDGVDFQKRWFVKSSIKSGIALASNKDDHLFKFGTTSNGYSISNIHVQGSKCHNLSLVCDSISNHDLNGTNDAIFSVSRIIVIQMV
ncbi:TLDc domain-containing protein [Entamoeba marina]